MGLSLLVMLGLACGEEKGQPSTDTAGSPNATKTDESNAKSANAKAGTQGAKTAATAEGKAAPARPRKIPHMPAFSPRQLGNHGRNVEFLGWTEDGEKFVVSVEQSTNWTYFDAGSASYSLYRIHDTLTGKLVRSFQNELDGKPDKDDRDAKTWKAAEPKAAWKKWRASASLVATAPALSSGNWSIGATVEEGTVDATDDLSLKRKDDHVRTKWTIAKAKAKRGKRPKINVTVTNGPTTINALVHTLPFKRKEFYEDMGGPITARGAIRAYPSPNGEHFVVVFNMRLMVDNDAFPEPVGGFFVRSFGPQLKVLHSDGGAEARALAAPMAKAFMPITVIEHSDTAVDSPILYYRNLSDAQLKSIADTVPGLATEKLEKEGWLDGILVLASP